VLGCELWMENFNSLGKMYIMICERLGRLNELCSTQPQSQSSAGDPRDGTVVGGQRRSGRKLDCKVAPSTCTYLDMWSMAGLLGLLQIMHALDILN